MKCRYCNTVFSPGENRCESCGAPKGPVVQTLLDRSSGAMRWMTDYRHALHLSLGATAALIGLHLLVSNEDGSNSALLFLLTAIWMVAAMPSILCVASIMSARGRLPAIAMNLLLSVLVWMGLAVAMLIGLAIAY